MIQAIIASAIGGILTVIIIETVLRVFIPWLKTKFMVSIDLRGTWVALWEWDNPDGQVKDEIQVKRQSGNDVSGKRIFFDELRQEYKFMGFYKDGLLVAYYWSADPVVRYGGVMVLRLDDKGKTLTGKLMYPEDGNLGRLMASNINSYEREGFN